jgi:phosphate-selective porin
MIKCTMRISLPALALAISASAAAAQQAAVEADLIVRNARIWTGDPRNVPQSVTLADLGGLQSASQRDY